MMENNFPTTFFGEKFFLSTANNREGPPSMTLAANRGSGWAAKRICLLLSGIYISKIPVFRRRAKRENKK